MGVRESLQKLADKKDSEISDLRLKLAQAEAYLQAIQDSLRVLPKEPLSDKAEPELRPGTLLSQARDILLTEGKPLHVNEILKRIGKTVNKSNRVSLSGSLSAYVRKRTIFKKAGPNIFALIDTPLPSTEVQNNGEGELPEGFGNVQ